MEDEDAPLTSTSLLQPPPPQQQPQLPPQQQQEETWKMRIVVLPADVDPSSSASYSADVECFHQFVETQRQQRVPSRRFLYLSLIPVFIVIVVVSSVLVSKNASIPSSASSSSTGGGSTLTSTGGSSASPPSTTRSSGPDATPTAPAVAPTYSQPSSPLASASDNSGTTPSETTTANAPVLAPPPTAFPSDGATVSTGPLYDESVLADHWLYAHNSRRDTFYAQHQLSPKRLKWSDTLATSAQNYSEALLTLLPGCTLQHGLQGNHEGGENLAMMWDTGFAITVLPELVLQAWFDNEQHHAFGDNGHWSQVAWRGSGYVGCGMAKKIPNSGFSCYVTTCRYIATGNCNMDANNQLSVMLQDTSPCPPACPAEGCF